MTGLKSFRNDLVRHDRFRLNRLTTAAARRKPKQAASEALPIALWNVRQLPRRAVLG